MKHLTVYESLDSFAGESGLSDSRRNSNHRLEVQGTLTKCTFSNQLLLSNQDKGRAPSDAHPLALPLSPALRNLTNIMGIMESRMAGDYHCTSFRSYIYFFTCTSPHTL